MLFFKTRNAARSFAGKVAHYKMVDAGADKIAGKRWAVQTLKK